MMFFSGNYFIVLRYSIQKFSINIYSPRLKPRDTLFSFILPPIPTLLLNNILVVKYAIILNNDRTRHTMIIQPLFQFLCAKYVQRAPLTLLFSMWCSSFHSIIVHNCVDSRVQIKITLPLYIPDIKISLYIFLKLWIYEVKQG